MERGTGEITSKTALGSNFDLVSVWRMELPASREGFFVPSTIVEIRLSPWHTSHLHFNHFQHLTSCRTLEFSSLLSLHFRAVFHVDGAIRGQPVQLDGYRRQEKLPRTLEGFLRDVGVSKERRE